MLPAIKGSEHPHASVLPARHIVRSISRTWELGRPIFVPGELLRPYSPGSPATHVVAHAVINDPVLATVWAGSETGVTNAICLFLGVLVEHTAFVVLLPVLSVHRVWPDKFELTEAVVAVVTSCSRINDEFLPGLWVRELLWAFVGGETIVFPAAVRSLLPGVLWDAIIDQDQHWFSLSTETEIAYLMICLSVRLDVTVQGSLILVMQRFAGQEEYAWYLE
jgi:hypothetical protein